MFTQRLLEGHFSPNTSWFKVKSFCGIVTLQIYFHKLGFSVGYNIPKADDEHVGNSLVEFMSNYDVPSHLTMDGATVQVGWHAWYMRLIQQNDIDYYTSHPQCLDENLSEGRICEIKRRFYWLMQKYNIFSESLEFDYTIETMSMTTNSS